MTRRLFGLIGVVVIAALAGAAWFAITDGPPDYEGAGTGTVLVEVAGGADGLAIAKELHAKEVVKSTQAFYELAIRDDRSADIRPGYYTLRKHMSAEAALAALLDSKNRQDNALTITEGSRLSKIVEVIAAKTDFSAEEVTAVLDNPRPLGLPASAEGNPEGYLYPATYVVDPGMTVTDLLTQMVDKTKRVAESLDIEKRAKALDMTYEELLTMASIIEWEANGRPEDRRKVARVFYNRLEKGIALQSDATVSYANNTEGEIWTTPEQRANPSLYNTYEHTGLPPGPIGSPGEAAIEAALHPADGDWLYFTLLDLDPGTTAFSETLAEHERNVDKFREYCRSHEGC